MDKLKTLSQEAGIAIVKLAVSKRVFAFERQGFCDYKGGSLGRASLLFAVLCSASIRTLG